MLRVVLALVATVVLAVALLLPETESLVADLTGHQGGLRGRAYGLYTMAAGVGAAIGPLVGGWMYDRASQAAPFYLNGGVLLADEVASSVDEHARFGGVVPEIASRKHTEAIVAVVDETLACAGDALGVGELAFADLDALGVTHGPGLVGALVVGLAYAKGVSFATGLPLVGVNHLEGHIFANVLADADVKPPLIALVVSGGHTSLVHMPEWGEYHTLGETLDDAAGDARGQRLDEGLRPGRSGTRAAVCRALSHRGIIEWICGTRLSRAPARGAPGRGRPSMNTGRQRPETPPPEP